MGLGLGLGLGLGSGFGFGFGFGFGLGLGLGSGAGLGLGLGLGAEQVGLPPLEVGLDELALEQPLEGLDQLEGREDRGTVLEALVEHLVRATAGEGEGSGRRLGPGSGRAGARVGPPGRGCAPSRAFARAP